MNDLEGLWIGINYLRILFYTLLRNMFITYLIKKKNFFFLVNTFYYFYLFTILNNNIFLKIDTIIDIAATHYPDNLNNEFELLYVNLLKKLNIRFFFKLYIKKENVVISISKIFKSAN